MATDRVPMNRAEVLEWIHGSDMPWDTAKQIEQNIEAWHARRKDVEAERDELRALVDLYADVNLDHGCNLDGYDDGCPECRAARAMHIHLTTGLEARDA